MRSKDLQAKTLVNLGSLWQTIVDVKSDYGVGPGDQALKKSRRSGRSLQLSVAKEARKCSRGFARMATLVNRT